MTGPAREHRCPMRLLLLALIVCSPAWASDEVDYSAPYVTLEDGKLVTKYPAKAHTNAAPATAASTAETSADAAAASPDGPGPSQDPTAAGPAGTGHPKALVAAAAALVGAAAAAVLLARRRNKTRRP